MIERHALAVFGSRVIMTLQLSPHKLAATSFAIPVVHLAPATITMRHARLAQTLTHHQLVVMDCESAI